MVHLIGVHHGMESDNILTGRTESQVFPSDGLKAYLSQFPRGTRVGLETFSDYDWKEVKADLREQCQGKRDILLDETSGRHYTVEYSEIHKRYWEILAQACGGLGLEPVPFENNEVAFRWNKATLNAAVLDALIHRRVLFKKDGENDEAYHRKLCKCNNARYRAELNIREIHEIERDNKMLENITNAGVQVVITGQGHSNFWWRNREDIAKRFGVPFESYCTDLITPTPWGVYRMIFTNNADCDSGFVFQKEALLRSLRVVETGRVVEDKDPSYVGVWDWVEPMKSYFEVFPGSENSGVIQDCLGTANFGGVIDGNGADFVKRYGCYSLPGVLTGDIHFCAFRDGDEFYGRFHAEKFGSIFCMKKGSKANPTEMAVRLAEKFRTQKERFKQFNFGGAWRD